MRICVDVCVVIVIDELISAKAPVGRQCGRCEQKNEQIFPPASRTSLRADFVDRFRECLAFCELSTSLHKYGHVFKKTGQDYRINRIKDVMILLIL